MLQLSIMFRSNNENPIVYKQTGLLDYLDDESTGSLLKTTINKSLTPNKITTTLIYYFIIVVLLRNPLL